ncbi:MAG: DUF4389 domain-containing protein [Gammaproteobacteria bacterium]
MSETVSPSIEESSFAKNLKSKPIWMRLLFMLVITFFYSVSRVVVGAVIIVQFLWVLFTGETNLKLQMLGISLATYTNQIILYLTFNTEERPFPFDADWPNQY